MKKKLLYFVTVDYYFYTHRLPLALAAQEAGYDVVVLTKEEQHGQRIREAGLRLVPFDISRRGMNFLAEIGVLARLIAVYWRERPDIVHHVAMKPTLYGTLAAKLCGVRCIVNAFAGMGWIFSSQSVTAKLARQCVKIWIAIFLRNTQVTVQNRDDQALMRTLGCRYVHLIRGSGIDTQAIQAVQEPPEPCLVLLAARMLWDKGIQEYVDAARLLKKRGYTARFLLAGGPDKQNPASIQQPLLQEWHNSGVIEWLGHREDVLNLLGQSHIACLPTYYREGLPKFLLEAAAIGRPLIAADVLGCREVVEHGVNGFLVSVRDAQALAERIATLLDDADLRQRMGAAGREKAVSEFDVRHVVGQYLNLYAVL